MRLKPGLYIREIGSEKAVRGLAEVLRANGLFVTILTERTTSSLSDLKNRSENSAGRGQILPVLQVNSHSIDQKSGEICTGQADLQPISFKSDRLLGSIKKPYRIAPGTLGLIHRPVGLLKQGIHRLFVAAIQADTDAG